MSGLFLEIIALCGTIVFFLCDSRGIRADQVLLNLVQTATQLCLRCTLSISSFLGTSFFGNRRHLV